MYSQSPNMGHSSDHCWQATCSLQWGLQYFYKHCALFAYALPHFPTGRTHLAHLMKHCLSIGAAAYHTQGPAALVQLLHLAFTPIREMREIVCCESIPYGW